ncbi:MAG TPA: nitrilase-related carbon-nitrogen hydrolase, partial [Syntrophales bacterium]|nr:nitrilase-related carbon-nitrogen hydrolase [Syntrophales bacterium]
MAKCETSTFFNLYNHGFIRVAVCIPEVKVADAPFNAASTIKLMKEASEQNAIFAIFPELGISAYSNEDLFHQDALLKSIIDALNNILEATKELNTILVIGAPLR